LSSARTWIKNWIEFLLLFTTVIMLPIIIATSYLILEVAQVWTYSKMSPSINAVRIETEGMPLASWLCCQNRCVSFYCAQRKLLINLLLSMSAQESWGLMVRVPPSITAKPYVMCVHSDQSMSSGTYFPIPCLQKEVKFRKRKQIGHRGHLPISYVYRSQLPCFRLGPLNN
jgi:hypothetical protein